MPRKTKSELENLSQLDGRVSTPTPTRLDVIMGESITAKYGGLNEEQYISKIEDMSKNELESHAHAIGVMIVDDIIRLRKNLIKEYRAHVSSADFPVQNGKAPTKLDPAALKILREGA